MSHVPFVTTGAYPARAGNRVRPLLDGEPALRRSAAAIEEARERLWVSVTFLWSTFAMPEGRGSFLELLARAERRGLEVRLLCWRPDDETAQLRANAFWGSPQHLRQLARQAPGVSVRWDRAHPGFCQHQKCWLLDAGLDTATAFVGSLNLNPHSVVSPGHAGAGQNHDLCLEVRGPATSDIHHNFVQRWNEASERDAADGCRGPDAGRALPVPDRLVAACGDTVVQVQRTIHPGRYSDAHPAPGGRPFPIADGESSILDQYLHALRAARETIYLEHQALSVPPVVEELVAAARRGVAVVAVVPAVASDIAAPADHHGEWLIAARRDLAQFAHVTLAGLAGRDAEGARHPVHVHAKLMIVDDSWATVGSANLHHYSMHGNSELNVAVADAAVVRALRRELFLEHLGEDTGALGGRAALERFRAVAGRNAARRERGAPAWEGIAHALDPLRYWPG